MFIMLMALAFSGCGMMGMHGFSSMPHHSKQQIGTTIIKEFEKDGLRGEVTVPSLAADETADIQLLLKDENGLISNAFVDFSFDDGRGNTVETIQIVGGQDGLYATEYVPKAEGLLKIAVDIYGLPQTEGVHVSVQKNVNSSQSNAWSGNTKYVLGGVGMGLMMLWMSGAHWH